MNSRILFLLNLNIAKFKQDLYYNILLTRRDNGLKELLERRSQRMKKTTTYISIHQFTHVQLV